ncbi:hypothetical protein ACERJO_20415 [Halalkalibacter sp. AB-rgal2]|uniref:hypothetical protein n=1 Tax=Halalkalibacter sp. AB-rgal2 TaxID=3242695 RepID=UPI00359E6A8A
MARLQHGDPLELIKPLMYRENIEGAISEFELPIGRKAEYLGQVRSRRLNVEDLHPEYINGELMHYEFIDLPGGHEVRVDDGHGFGCYYTFKDWDEVFEYFKVPRTEKDHQNAV